MVWMPAKDAAVPNLLPAGRLETANQLTLATTYGITPVAAALLLAGLTTGPVRGVRVDRAELPRPDHLRALLPRPDPAGHRARGVLRHQGDQRPRGERRRSQPGHAPRVRRRLGVRRQDPAGARPGARHPRRVRRRRHGGRQRPVLRRARSAAATSTFYLLFAHDLRRPGDRHRGRPEADRRAVPAALVRPVDRAGRRRGRAARPSPGTCRSRSLGVLLVGIGAGMAFLSGTTLLGGEVADEVRGRVFGFVNMATRVVLMLAIALSSVLVGLGSDRDAQPSATSSSTISTTRILLLAAGVVGVFAGIARVPADGRQARACRSSPTCGARCAAGRWAVPEPVARAGARSSSSRAARAPASRPRSTGSPTALRGQGRDVVVTREPGATDVGARIRSLRAGPARRRRRTPRVAPRAEALLYAADRAHHVATVVRPALARGAVVISDRYVDSSLAYQGAGRTLPVEEVSWLSAWATGGLQARPGGAARHRPGGRAGPGRRPRRAPTGWRASRSPSTSGSGTPSSTSPPPTPRRYLVLDAHRGRPSEIAAAVARAGRHAAARPADRGPGAATGHRGRRDGSAGAAAGGRAPTGAGRSTPTARAATASTRLRRDRSSRGAVGT